MKKKVIYGLVAILGIACIASVVLMKETQKSNKIIPIHHKETFGSLAYEIKLEKNQFDLDDEIEVYAKLTNAGKDTVTYRSGSSSCPTHVGIRIVNQKTNTILATKPLEDNQGCTADDGISQLAPAETVEDMQIFIPKQWIKSELEPVNAGTYDLEIFLPDISLAGKEKVRKLATKIPITVHEADAND